MPSPFIPTEFDPSNLLAADVGRFFDKEPQVVAVPLKRAPNPKLIWLNQRAAARDPAYLKLGGDWARYCDHLIDSCAYVVCAPSDAEKIGKADRYGGSGVGQNGGSGRCAVLDGYCVKGIGRTSLIGKGTESEHATGGAYLEEMVRDTIFSEIFAAELPHGAIPNIAIIDTGTVEQFREDTYPPAERRVLAIRPVFLRPAHFQRSLIYSPGSAGGSKVDSDRVYEQFEALRTRLRQDEYVSVLQSLWVSWAEQLAYTFVHRISVGDTTTSNICLDGKCVDFGAATALPGWGNFYFSMGRLSVGGELNEQRDCMTMFFADLERYGNFDGDSESIFKSTLEKASQAYDTALSVEFLRLCGLDRQTVSLILSGTRAAEFKKVRDTLFRHFMQQYADLRQRPLAGLRPSTPAMRIPWDFGGLWSDRPPDHLIALRRYLERAHLNAELARHRSLFLVRSRPTLYGAELRLSLHSELDVCINLSNLDGIGDIISRHIAMGRRDSMVTPTKILGFAVSESFSGALCHGEGTHMALAVEWMNGQLKDVLAPSEEHDHFVIDVQRLCENGILVRCTNGVKSSSFLPCKVAVTEE